MGYSLYSSDDGSPGVQRLVAPQDTSEAARQAVEPQAHGDEFHPKPNPDIKMLLARLTEVERESTEICNQLYMPMKNGVMYPPLTYMQREELHERQNSLDAERSAICAQLKEIYEAMEGHKVSEIAQHHPYEGDARVVG